jgi:hypothetical protein
MLKKLSKTGMVPILYSNQLCRVLYTVVLMFYFMFDSLLLLFFSKTAWKLLVSVCVMRQCVFTESVLL